MDLIDQNARYSRSDLLALRYEESSRQRPSCANRIELQTLNFWKINGLPLSLINATSSNNSYGSKLVLSPERDNVSLSSSSGLLNSRRALRNRERAHNYYQRFTTGDAIGEDAQASLAPATANLCSASYKSTNVDHRSISSSHLMPAFAKRRFVVPSGGNVDSSESQIEKSNASANFEDGLSNVNENAPMSFQSNADQKNNTRAASCAFSSPMRRNAAAAAEWERNEKHLHIQQDNQQSSRPLSPTLISGKQGLGINLQERRIGSGRLLPRNDNWEFKHKDTELINVEKDRPQNGNIAVQQRQRSCSNKQTTERSSDNVTDRDRDRRGNERRGEDSNRDQHDVKKNVSSGRRASNKDKFNYGDTAVQSRGKRMNMYHEPEWFSAGPTSQHETIDLHGFDDIEYESSSKLKTVKDSRKMETQTSRSSSIASVNLTETICNNDEAFDTSKSNGSNRNNNVNVIAKSEIEFNFDAFLNMDPMGNDGDVQGEVKGTSRFSRWFGSKELTSCCNELGSCETSSTLEKQEIPSVKDLEAQMKKVDLRPENDLINKIENSSQLSKMDQRDTSVTKDTEGFKRILQQLGSQSDPHQLTESHPIILNVRGGPYPPSHNLHDRHQQFTRSQDYQIKDELQLYHQENKKIDAFQHGHVEVASQSSLHPSHTTGINDPNISQTQTRMEIQNLLQGILRGDVSREVLEKEISNPSTTAQSREIISAVLYECRNALPPKPLHPNDLNNSIKNTHFFNKNMALNVSEEFFSQNNLSQHVRHSNSPTPLAFTPTSVLRKMTADKESTTLHNNSAVNQQYHQHQLSSHYSKPTVVHNTMSEQSVIPSINQMQPRMILGGNFAMQHQLIANSPQMSPKQVPQVSQPRIQQNKWTSGNMQSSHGAKTFGRPILKGTLNSSSQQMLPVAFPLTNELQQIHQQRLKTVQLKETINSDNIHGGPPTPIQNVIYTDGIAQMHHHYMQQQQRPQLRNRNVHGDVQRQTNIQIQQASPMTGVPDAAESTNFITSNNIGPLNSHRDGRLSPTTNQLAQWFSPELLARASAGKLPLLNMNQALSLEEFERSMQHSSATVLN